MDGDFIAKSSAGVAALGASIYGVIRLLKFDRREDSKAELTDGAVAQVIQTLRDEVGRLSERLAKVEEENRKCEERNLQLHLEILELKKQLNLT